MPGRKREEKLFVLDNFQGYEDFSFSCSFSFSAPTYTRRKTCGCLETREGKVIFFLFFAGEKGTITISRQQLVEGKHKCLAMMEKSIFRRVTSSIISSSLSCEFDDGGGQKQGDNWERGLCARLISSRNCKQTSYQIQDDFMPAAVAVFICESISMILASANSVFERF